MHWTRGAHTFCLSWHFVQTGLSTFGCSCLKHFKISISFNSSRLMLSRSCSRWLWLAFSPERRAISSFRPTWEDWSSCISRKSSCSFWSKVSRSVASAWIWQDADNDKYVREFLKSYSLTSFVWDSHSTFNSSCRDFSTTWSSRVAVWASLWEAIQVNNEAIFICYRDHRHPRSGGLFQIVSLFQDGSVWLVPQVYWNENQLMWQHKKSLLFHAEAREGPLTSNHHHRAIPALEVLTMCSCGHWVWLRFDRGSK